MVWGSRGSWLGKRIEGIEEWKKRYVAAYGRAPMGRWLDETIQPCVAARRVVPIGRVATRKLGGSLRNEPNPRQPERKSAAAD